MKRSGRKHNKIKTKKLYIILMIISLCTVLLSFLLRKIPGAVEAVYSSIIYKIISQVLGLVFGIFPVSIAEMLFYLLIFAFLILTLYTIIRTVVNLIKKKKKAFRPFLSLFIILTAAAMILYSSFYFMWAFNFNRKSFAVLNNWKIEKAPVSELYDLCVDLVKKCNETRKLVKTDDKGVMVANNGKEDALKRARSGYVNASKDFPMLKGLYSRPKAVYTSKFMSYAGLTGIFVPFTYEANVNMMTPDSSFLHTIMHEMAHQRGFSREDEANFIGYLACKYHPDPDFQYSGYYHALLYSLNTLNRYDNKKADKVWEMLSDDVLKDIKYENDFWKQFESPIEEITTAINDNYLKVNHQYDGVYSYGRVVDLLLAERRQNK